MAVEIQALSKRFGNKWVLRDASFDLVPGEVFGLCGASASGKTTLLKILAGQHKASSGRVLLDGLNLLSMKPKDRGVFLKDADTITGFALFVRGPKGSGISGGEKKNDKLIDAVTARDTSLLLLDEPLLHMHPQMQAEWAAKIRDHASSAAVLIASSDFELLTKVCDRIAMLDGGEIRQIGTPEEIYDAPATASIARLTGDHNLFAARRLTSSDADLPEFITLDGEHRIFAQPTQKQKLGSINQNVTLAIRPEQVVISMGASFPEDNLIRAVVKRVLFRGSTNLIEFDASGLTLYARVFKVVGLNVGDECMLGLPPHRIQVLIS